MPNGNLTYRQQCEDWFGQWFDTKQESTSGLLAHFISGTKKYETMHCVRTYKVLPILWLMKEPVQIWQYLNQSETSASKLHVFCWPSEYVAESFYNAICIDLTQDNDH